MKPVIINTNEEAVKNITSLLATSICPIVIDIASHYASLGIGEFNQEIYEDILINKSQNIKQRFTEYVENEIRTSKLSAPIKKMLDSENYISESLAPLEKEVSNLFSVMLNLQSRNYDFGQSTLQDIEIVNSLPRIRQEIIKRRYQIIVDTEEKIELLRLMENMVNTYDQIRAKADEIGTYIIPYFIDYFIQDQVDGRISINPDVFSFFDEQSESVIRAYEANALNISRWGSKMIKRTPQRVL